MKLYLITYSKTMSKKDMFGDRKTVTRVGEDVIYSDRDKKGIRKHYPTIKGCGNRKVTSIKHIEPKKV